MGPASAVVCRDNGGKVQARFELEPVAVEGWPDGEPSGRLYVWEWPKKGEQYGIGVDPSEGVGEDSSVVQVVKQATPWHPDEQVAEFSSSLVGPHDLWAFVFALAHIYAVQQPTGRVTWPFVVIETNIAAGDAVQTEMLKRGYGNFYQRVDMTLVGS